MFEITTNMENLKESLDAICNSLKKYTNGTLQYHDLLQHDYLCVLNKIKILGLPPISFLHFTYFISDPKSPEYNLLSLVWYHRNMPKTFFSYDKIIDYIKDPSDSNLDLLYNDYYRSGDVLCLYSFFPYKKCIPVSGHIKDGIIYAMPFLEETGELIAERSTRQKMYDDAENRYYANIKRKEKEAEAERLRLEAEAAKAIEDEKNEKIRKLRREKEKEQIGYMRTMVADGYESYKARCDAANVHPKLKKQWLWAILFGDKHNPRRQNEQGIWEEGEKTIWEWEDELWKNRGLQNPWEEIRPRAEEIKRRLGLYAKFDEIIAELRKENLIHEEVEDEVFL